jgi:hypothetical protein
LVQVAESAFRRDAQLLAESAARPRSSLVRIAACGERRSCAILSPTLLICVHDARSRLVNRCDPPGHAQTEYYPARVTKNLRKNPAISKRPSTCRFFPRVSVAAAGAKTPWRIEPRAADVLPAKAAGSEKDGPRGKPFAAPRAFGKARKTADGKTDPPRTLSAIAVGARLRRLLAAL